MLTVYSKTVCPYCTQAKNLLKLKNIDFTEVNIEQDTDARNKMVSMGLRTVPQIFKGQELFVEGGCQGLSNLSDEELDLRLGRTNLGTL
jgi:glutaredoxin 3